MLASTHLLPFWFALLSVNGPQDPVAPGEIFAQAVRLRADGDATRAAALLATAADAGHAPAAHELATMLRAGVGVEVDLQQAWFRFNDAAEAGYAPAQLEVARASASGTFGELRVDRDALGAAELLVAAMGADDTAAAARQELEALLAADEGLARSYLAEGILKRPIDEVRRDLPMLERLLLESFAEEAWYPTATLLGRLYQLRELPTFDLDRAERYLEFALQDSTRKCVRPSPEAQFELGRCLRAQGIAADDLDRRTRGVELLCASAEQGHAPAATALRDLEEAGDADFAFVNGCRLLIGEAGVGDPKAAQTWLSRAVAAGHPLALRRHYEAVCAAEDDAAGLAMLRERAPADSRAAALLAEVEKAIAEAAARQQADLLARLEPGGPSPGSGFKSVGIYLDGGAVPDLEQFWFDSLDRRRRAWIKEERDTEYDDLVARLRTRVGQQGAPDRFAMTALGITAFVESTLPAAEPLREALGWFERAATAPAGQLEPGMAEAAAFLGHLRLTAWDDGVRDAGEACRWLERAAGWGAVPAALLLGKSLIDGRDGVGKDVRRGMKVLEPLLQRGSAEAAEWLAKAAGALGDHAESMRYLAVGWRLGSERAWNALDAQLRREYPPALYWYGVTVLDDLRQTGRDAPEVAARAAAKILQAGEQKYAPAAQWVVANLETAPASRRVAHARLCLFSIGQKQAESLRIVLDGALFRDGTCCYAIGLLYFGGHGGARDTTIPDDKLQALFWLREANGFGIGDAETHRRMRTLVDSLEETGLRLPGDADPLEALLGAERLAKLGHMHRAALRVILRKDGAEEVRKLAERVLAKQSRAAQHGESDARPRFEPEVDAMRLLARLHQQQGGQPGLACFWLERAEEREATAAGAQALSTLRQRLGAADRQVFADKLAAWGRLPIRTVLAPR